MKKDVTELLVYEFYAKKVKVILVTLLSIAIAFLSYGLFSSNVNTPSKGQAFILFILFAFAAMLLREFLFDRKRPTLVFTEQGILSYPQYIFMKRNPYLLNWKDIEKIKYKSIRASVVYLNIKMKDREKEKLTFYSMIKALFKTPRTMIMIDPVYQEKPYVIFEKARKCLEKFG